MKLSIEHALLSSENAAPGPLPESRTLAEIAEVYLELKDNNVENLEFAQSKAKQAL